MPTFISRTAIIVLMMNSVAVVGKTCGIDQYLNRKGKCRDCKFCPPGEGMDFSIEVAQNTCHPCKSCPEGYYNDPAYGQYECIMCRLNCATMNRKEYEPCGGTKPGTCGGCIDSLYEDRENNLDSPCTKKKETVKRIQPETNAKVLSQEDSDSKGLNSGSIENIHKELSGGIVFAAAAAAVGLFLMCAMVIYIIKKRIKRTSRHNNIAPEQSTTLLESTCRINEGVEREQYNSVDIDLEIDGPSNNGTANERSAYGELQTYNSSGPTGLQIDSETSSVDARKPQRTYPNTVVTEGDKYFTYLSKNLYGDAVSEVFRALEVRDQKIFAELELYRLERINYQESIYRLLLHWCRLKTNNARLDVICPILDKEGLSDVSQQLLTLALEAKDSQERNLAERAPAVSGALQTDISLNLTNHDSTQEVTHYLDRQSSTYAHSYSLDSHSLHSLSLLSCDKLDVSEDEE